MEERYKIELENVLKNKREYPDSLVSTKFKGLKVMGLIGDFSACGYYRIINPLHMLKRMGAEVLYSPICDFSQIPNYDYFIIPRQHNDYAYSFVRSCNWQEKPTIFELDDNLEAVEEHNPAYYYYHKGSVALKGMSKVVNRCWGMTASTKDLGLWYKSHNSNMCIIDNYIDFSLRDWNTRITWKNGDCTITPGPDRRPAAWKDKIVIGWSGGTSHTEDLMLIGPTIKRILNERKDVIFVMYTSVQMYEGFCSRNKIDKDRVHKIQARHFTKHPEALHGMDIQLAPVTNTLFNDSKTSLKMKEAMAAGAIPIGSCVPPYARFHHQTSGLARLVSTENSFSYDTWYEAIMDAIEDKKKLEETKEACKLFAIENFSLEKNIDKWPAAWKHIESKVKNDLELGNSAPKPVSYRNKLKPTDVDPILGDRPYKEGYFGVYGHETKL